MLTLLVSSDEEIPWISARPKGEGAWVGDELRLNCIYRPQQARAKQISPRSKFLPTSSIPSPQVCWLGLDEENGKPSRVRASLLIKCVAAAAGSSSTQSRSSCFSTYNICAAAVENRPSYKHTRSFSPSFASFTILHSSAQRPRPQPPSRLPSSPSSPPRPPLFPMLLPLVPRFRQSG